MTYKEWTEKILAAADRAATVMPAAMEELASTASIWTWEEAREALIDLLLLRPYTKDDAYDD